MGATLKGVVLREDDSVNRRTYYHYPLQDKSEKLWKPTDKKGNRNSPGKFRIVYDPSTNTSDDDIFDVLIHTCDNEFEVLDYYPAKKEEAKPPAIFGPNGKLSKTEWPCLPSAK